MFGLLVWMPGSNAMTQNLATFSTGKLVIETEATRPPELALEDRMNADTNHDAEVDTDEAARFERTMASYVAESASARFSFQGRPPGEIDVDRLELLGIEGRVSDEPIILEQMLSARFSSRRVIQFHIDYSTPQNRTEWT
ncbi:MAG: hypothetical protein LC624_10800, partial [Halobacteriales archaeon]|nr:hypothetical protein [Halobacteriales archaeon]